MKRFHARATSDHRRMRAWMVSFVATITLFGTTNNSFALEPVPDPGATKISSGIALMVGGLFSAGLGTGIYVLNEDSRKTEECTPCGIKATAFPVTLMAIGATMFAAGTAFAVVGLTQRTAATPQAPTATLSIGPLGGSLRVVF